MMTRLFVTISAVMLSAGPMAGFQPPTDQGGFVPVDQLPPVDQVAAAPLLIMAYAFVCVAVLLYVWTVWHRLNKVEQDMHALSQRSQPR
jgi:hypothetical protein